MLLRPRRPTGSGAADLRLRACLVFLRLQTEGRVQTAIRTSANNKEKQQQQQQECSPAPIGSLELLPSGCSGALNKTDRKLVQSSKNTQVPPPFGFDTDCCVFLLMFFFARFRGHASCSAQGRPLCASCRALSGRCIQAEVGETEEEELSFCRGQGRQHLQKLTPRRFSLEQIKKNNNNNKKIQHGNGIRLIVQNNVSLSTSWT